MAAPILQLGCVVQCLHGGVATPIPSNAKVLVGGSPALLATDQWVLTPCAFVLGPKPSPCVRIQWTMPALRVTVNGAPVLLATSIGLCLSAEGLPQGLATVAGAQTKVLGE
jgi:hypothetical protein